MNYSIDNKFFDNKYHKDLIKFNKKINRWRDKVLKKDESKWTKREISLFKCKDFEFPAIECNGFYTYNEISHILIPLCKTDVETVYDQLILLIKNNPEKNSFLPSLNDDQRLKIKDSISFNSFGETSIGRFSPNDEFLMKYISYISVKFISISVMI